MKTQHHNFEVQRSQKITTFSGLPWAPVILPLGIAVLPLIVYNTQWYLRLLEILKSWSRASFCPKTRCHNKKKKKKKTSLLLPAIRIPERYHGIINSHICEFALKLQVLSMVFKAAFLDTRCVLVTCKQLSPFRSYFLKPQIASGKAVCISHTWAENNAFSSGIFQVIKITALVSSPEARCPLSLPVLCWYPAKEHLVFQFGMWCFWSR